jgi:hypothetical protein
MSLNGKQRKTLFWLMLEVSEAIAQGCRDRHEEDVEGIRSLIPLLDPEDATLINGLLEE